MKTIILLLSLLLTTSAFAGSWVTLGVYQLSGTSTSIEIGEKLGNIENLRFQIDGQTVTLNQIKAIPLKGEPIILRNPGLLKSGEGSGLIRIGEKAIPLASLEIDYAITAHSAVPATLTLRLKQD